MILRAYLCYLRHLAAIIQSLHQSNKLIRLSHQSHLTTQTWKKTVEKVVLMMMETKFLTNQPVREFVMPMVFHSAVFSSESLWQIGNPPLTRVGLCADHGLVVQLLTSR